MRVLIKSRTQDHMVGSTCSKSTPASVTSGSPLALHSLPRLEVQMSNLEAVISRYSHFKKSFCKVSTGLTDGFALRDGPGLGSSALTDLGSSLWTSAVTTIGDRGGAMGEDNLRLPACSCSARSADTCGIGATTCERRSFNSVSSRRTCSIRVLLENDDSETEKKPLQIMWTHT